VQLPASPNHQDFVSPGSPRLEDLNPGYEVYEMDERHVAKVLFALHERHGHVVNDIGHAPAVRLDLWAKDASGRSHADYDHYVQECDDCQRAWIAAILEAME
jgi:hypothetical protein